MRGTLLLAAALALASTEGVSAKALPYVGEIEIFPYTFCPIGWLETDGSLLQIAEYDTLFALLGTTYGGDGSTTFALPKLTMASAPATNVAATPYKTCIAVYGLFPSQN